MTPCSRQWCGALVCALTVTLGGCGDDAATDARTDASTTDARTFALTVDAYSLAAPDAAADAAADDGSAIVETEAPASYGPLLGTWYLRVAGARFVVTFGWNRVEARVEGSMLREGAPSLTVPDTLTIDAWGDAGELRFRRSTGVGVDWYRARVVEGVMTGRVASRPALAGEPAITDYSAHVTGWNSAWIDRELAPRAWDVTLDSKLRATLRIDRAVGGVTEYVGTLKVYASVERGIVDEQREHDLGVLSWDGTHLEFYLMEGELRQYYSAEVAGRAIAGTFLSDGDEATRPWSGTRRDVLGYGLVARTDAERDAWQARARRQIAHLVMADAPTPLTAAVTAVATDVAPIAEGVAWPARDDDATHYPQHYRLTELRLSYTLPNPYGATPLTREVHAWLARPTTPAPREGYPVAVAVNGHWGSAYQVMTPNSPYWYGDAFARRGYVVLAVDASHRPLADRSARYTDLTAGDDPAHGNGPHPAIAAPGMDSDWEEDGERAWDAMRALDYALSLPYVDARRVVAVGLSMGAEVASIAGALDTRAAAVVPTGFSPDIAVFQYRHHPCWDWAHADVGEYVDVSDYHALVAPRALVVETGRADTTYSLFVDPFAADKQVLRRSRAAFAATPERVVHYLHYDGHNFHVGGLGAAQVLERGVRVPLVVAPRSQWSLDWQGDADTRVAYPTLFDSLDALVR